MKSFRSSRLLYIALVSVFALLSLPVAAQSRDFLRESIDKYGECRNVAITQGHGSVMLFGINGWVADEFCPSSLKRNLRKLHQNGEDIVDVCITQSGNWIILYGRNGFNWLGVPDSLIPVLYKCNGDDEEVVTVTFRDDGDWVVVTKNYVDCNNPDIYSWIMEGCELYGNVRTVTMSDDGIIVIYEKGHRTSGEVPETLCTALSNTDIEVHCVKFAGEAWFFSDGVARYEYLM